MNALLEKYRGDGFEDMYCTSYRDGVAFSKDKVELMWEQWKARAWSNNLDERDYENAKLADE